MEKIEEEIKVNEYKENYFNQILNCINECGYVTCDDDFNPIELTWIQEEIFKNEKEVFIVDSCYSVRIKTGIIERFFTREEEKIKKVQIIIGSIHKKEGDWIINVIGREVLPKMKELAIQLSKQVKIPPKRISISLISESIQII